MNENDIYNILKGDNILREAIRRREQKQPPMPADLNDRLLQRMEETVPIKANKSRRIKWHWIAAACVAAMMIVLLIPQTGSDECVIRQKREVNLKFAEAEKEKRITNPDNHSSRITNSTEQVIYSSDESVIRQKRKANLKFAEAKKEKRITNPDNQSSRIANSPELDTNHYDSNSLIANSTEQTEQTLSTSSEASNLQAQAKPVTLTERDIPITRPENYRYTPEEIELLKKQANEAYVKWVQLELEIAKYNLEQMAQQ